MSTRKTTIPVGGLGGVDAVAAYLDGPPKAEWLLALAPGAGAPVDSEFMSMLSAKLAAEGVRTLRFDFPYQMRARDEGRKKPPDRAVVLEGTWRAALAYVSRRLKPARLAIGGKSMGGRYATMVLAAADPLPTRPVATVLFGYPLHPPGKPDRLRAAHLGEVGVPALFLGGTRDSLAGIEALRSTVSALPDATLHEIPDADHDFKVPKRSGRTRDDVVAELASATAAFLAALPNNARLGSRIHRRFAAIDGVELDAPNRNDTPRAPDLAG